MNKILFETNRLRIREFCDSDIDDLYSLLSNSMVMEYCEGPLDYTKSQIWLESIKKYYQSIGYDYWAVIEKETNDFVGQMGILKQEVDGEWIDCLAFMLSKNKWGRGYATEGALACMNYAYVELKINKIFATVEKENTASKKVLEKLGMQYVRDAVCFSKEVCLYLMENIGIYKVPYVEIEAYRREYLNSLSEFQDLYIELMIKESTYYSLQNRNTPIGYAIVDKEGVLIEFYVGEQNTEELNTQEQNTQEQNTQEQNTHNRNNQNQKVNELTISQYNTVLSFVLKQLSIQEIYCKTFDALLYSYCLEMDFKSFTKGLLYRDYQEPKIIEDQEIRMVKGDISSKELILAQDDSLKELYETEELLVDFLQNEHTFLFYKQNELIGCGMIILTKSGWNYCDLGVWVAPNKRGQSFGGQILIKLRAFALENQLIPSCGCSIDNIASQKSIEKSGYVSNYQLITFIS